MSTGLPSWGERRANLDGVNDALAQLTKTFDQHNVAAKVIAGNDGQLLRRLAVGFEDADWHKVMSENLSERKVIGISPASDALQKHVKKAQDAVVAKLDQLDRTLNETFVVPLKNAFAATTKSADFTRVRHVVETAVSNGQARRAKAYFRRLFDINSPAPTAFYRSYTQKNRNRDRRCGVIRHSPCYICQGT